LKASFNPVEYNVNLASLLYTTTTHWQLPPPLYHKWDQSAEWAKFTTVKEHHGE